MLCQEYAPPPAAGRPAQGSGAKPKPAVWPLFASQKLLLARDPLKVCLYCFIGLYMLFIGFYMIVYVSYRFKEGIVKVKYTVFNDF